jgi:hypothetical protein
MALQSQVGPAYDALKADPSRAIAVDEIRATLAIEHKLATANVTPDGASI